MTILIILVALIAIAFIFGRGAAQVIVLGSGAIGVIVVIIILGINLFPGLWEWIQTNKTAEVILGGLLFIFVIRPAFASAWAFLTKEKDLEHGQNEDVKSELPKQKELTLTQIAIVFIIVLAFVAWFQ